MPAGSPYEGLVLEKNPMAVSISFGELRSVFRLAVQVFEEVGAAKQFFRNEMDGAEAAAVRMTGQISDGKVCPLSLLKEDGGLPKVRTYLKERIKRRRGAAHSMYV